MVIFVIGANCTGKTHFIAQHFSEERYTVLNVFDYQQRAEKEHAELSALEQLHWANDALKDDVVALVRQGRNVVVEQTFFRALRRIAYVDAIRAAALDIPIKIYAMTPSDEQLRRNCAAREKSDYGVKSEFERIKREMTEIFEFPDVAEGYTKIYAVTDGEITERRDAPDPAKIEAARTELRRESAARSRKRAEQEAHERLIRETEHIRFWHYCEACGKKELLTADEAFEQGWDYPPRMYEFRMLSPRTCGDCSITSTLHWKLVTGEADFFSLNEHDKETLEQIKNEPESLMPGENDQTIHFPIDTTGGKI